IAGSQPQWLAHAGFRRALYAEHPYGRVLPTPASLKTLNVDTARSFWSKRAGLASTRVMVAGLFPGEAELDAARGAFEGWTAGDASTSSPSEQSTSRVVRLLPQPGA